MSGDLHRFVTQPDEKSSLDVEFTIAALLGPRQCGKTTLAKMIAEHEPCTYFDLENPVDVRRLDAPLRALEEL